MHEFSEQIRQYLANGWIRADSFYIFLDSHDKTFSSIPILQGRDVLLFFFILHEVTEEINPYLVNVYIRAENYYIFLNTHEKAFPNIPLLTKPQTHSSVCSLINIY